jgi:hypothetical protein
MAAISACWPAMMSSARRRTREVRNTTSATLLVDHSSASSAIWSRDAFVGSERYKRSIPTRAQPAFVAALEFAEDLTPPA